MEKFFNNMYGEKWYLNTWFIGLLFVFSFMIIPFFAGVVFLIQQCLENKKQNERYGVVDDIEAIRLDFQAEKEKISSELSQVQNSVQNSKNRIWSELSQVQNDLNAAKEELRSVEDDVIIAHFHYSDYDNISSEECKNEISLLKIKESDLLKSENAVKISNFSNTKKVNDTLKKQILRCFNSECDNVLMNITVKNIDASRSKINKSYETLNKLFSMSGVSMTAELLSLKLEQLNLTYVQALKKEEEKEIQKAIKEQMLEEEKVRKEIEKQKKEIEKDETQFKNELNRLTKYLHDTSNDIEKQLYIDKIKELEEKLTQLGKKKEEVIQRGENAKAGYVYIISNIGSFGDDVYKIGMTRRLEPMDRINELSSASVPFSFDVHAMIFSENAPELETELHQHFKEQSVNKVNFRKEFFKVSLDEIDRFVIENYSNAVHFTKVPAAKEYRQSISM